VRTLGNIGDKDTENEVLLLEHDIPHNQFSKDVLDCLPAMPWSISDEVNEIYFITDQPLWWSRWRVIPHFSESQFAENPCRLLIFLKRKCQ